MLRRDPSAARETCVNSDLPAAPFKTGWISFDLGDARPCDRTYCLYAAADLPPLPSVQRIGELQWLTPLAPDLDRRMRPYRPWRDPGDRSRALQRLATAARQVERRTGPPRGKVVVSLPTDDAQHLRWAA
jgi:hypothetical protein